MLNSLEQNKPNAMQCQKQSGVTWPPFLVPLRAWGWQHSRQNAAQKKEEDRRFVICIQLFCSVMTTSAHLLFWKGPVVDNVWRYIVCWITMPRVASSEWIITGCIEWIWRPAETFSWNSGVFYDTLGTMYALPCVFIHIMPKQTFLWPFSINFWVFSSKQWKICCFRVISTTVYLFVCLQVMRRSVLVCILNIAFLEKSEKSLTVKTPKKTPAEFQVCISPPAPHPRISLSGGFYYYYYYYYYYY